MRKHRGAAPGDALFFDENRLGRLREAVCDLSWLLIRGYRAGAAVTFVGNRYQLSTRERRAIVHVASDGAARTLPETFDTLKDDNVCIDGFNLLITLETALGGGIVLPGMDGCYRDIADIRGSYSLRIETEAAVELALETLKAAGVAEAVWLFDRPVSNSGRLAKLVNETAEKLGIPARAGTADRVDSRIKACDGVAVTADSDILSHTKRWFDLAGWIITRRIKDANIVDLRCPEAVQGLS